MKNEPVTAAEVTARRNNPDVLKREKEFFESIVQMQQEVRELIIVGLLNRTLEIIKELDLAAPPEEINK